MKATELLEKLKNHEYTFDAHGHNSSISPENAQAYFLETLTDKVEDWFTLAKELPDNIFATKPITRDYVVGDRLNDSECYCWGCGCNLYFYLKDETTIGLITPKNFFDNKSLGFNSFDASNIVNCVWTAKKK